MAESAADTDGPGRIFISYSRKDSGFVDRLAAELDRRGYEILLDRDDISGGEAWKERLDALILQADAVAFVLSPDSVASPVCGWETDRTVQLGKRLLPLCLRPVDVATTPEQIARLNFIFVDTEERFEGGIDKLCDACNVDINWVREHTRLVDRAARWNSAQRPHDQLIRGAELHRADAWLATRPRAAPEIPEELSQFLLASRKGEARARRRAMIAMTTAALGLSLAVVIAVGAAVGIGRLMSGMGDRASNTLAELAAEASDRGEYEMAARYAAAGLNGSDWTLIGFDADAAEIELARASAQSRTLAVLRGPDKEAYDAVFSPDGRSVAVAYQGGSIVLWSAETGQQAVQIAGPAGGCGYIAFSPDGARLLGGCADGSAHVWDVRSGGELLSLAGHQAYITSATFDAGGTRILTSSYDRTACIWDAASGAELFVLREHTAEVLTAAFSADGQRVITGSNDQTARVWDAQTGRQLTVLRGHFNASVTGVAFSLDGTRAFTVGLDRTTRFWDVASGREQVLVRRGSDALAMSADGSRLLVVSGSSAAVLDTQDGREIAVLEGHDREISAGVFNSSGTLVLTASLDGSARLWDAASGREITVLRGHESIIYAAGFDPRGTRVVTASMDRSARVWAAQPDRLLLEGSRGRVLGLTFSPDGSRLATASQERTIRIWDTTSGRQLASLPGGSMFYAPVFSPDGARLFGASLDGGVFVWDTRTWRQTAVIREPSPQSSPTQRRGFRVRFSPDVRRMVVLSDDAPPSVWDIVAGREIARLVGHQGSIRDAAFSPDGERVATVGEDDTARVWSAPTGREISRAGLSDVAFTSVRFTPDGARILTAADFDADGGELVRTDLWDAANGTHVRQFPGGFLTLSTDGSLLITESIAGDGVRRVQIWEVAGGAPRTVLRSRGNGFTSAQFSSDNTAVLTGAFGDYRLWDAATGRELFRLQDGGGSPSGAALSHDASTIATGSADGAVRLWRMPAALAEDRSTLRRQVCAAVLSDRPSHAARRSLFRPSELAAAPVLDARLDADVCAPATFSTRILGALGIATRRS